MNRKISSVFILTVLALTTASVHANGQATLVGLHDTAYNVNLAQGLNEPKIQAILDRNIGTPREVITFDNIAKVYVNPGQFDYRFVNQGIVLEGISGTIWVGGRGDSGPINGGHMDVAPRFVSSRIRVHFVKPGTQEPATVKRVGAFTTTPDRNKNCWEFYDSSGISLGAQCAQMSPWYPATNIDFTGGAYCRGFSHVDIYSISVPYEVDLLAFSDVLPEGCVTPVDIDIKPGSDPNSININNKGVIPVAILTTDDFDAADVNADTIKFGLGDASSVHSGHLEDVDSDGDIDLVLHFNTQDAGIGADDTQATLTGETNDGQKIEGSDSVRPLDKGSKKK